MFGGVYTFEDEPEGKEYRMMEISFMKACALDVIEL